VLVLRRIHVVLTLEDVPADKVEAARRAHDGFKLKCPVYRSLHQAIDITTELALVEGPPAGVPSRRVRLATAARPKRTGPAPHGPARPRRATSGST
jgi:hypothetical protein